MSIPLFANSWYGKLPTDEVRKEVQNLYEILGSDGGPVDWADLTGVPATFPPDVHVHDWADITTGVPDFATRWPTWSEVTSKPTTFPPDAHTHVTADITNLSSYTGLDVRYYTESEVDALLAGKANTSHTHSTSDITNLSSYTGFDARYYTESEVDAFLTAQWGLMPNGTAGTPGLRFAGDPNTGIYQLSADELNISAGGTRRVRVSNTAPYLEVSDGVLREVWHAGNVPRASGTFTPTWQPASGSVTAADNVGFYWRIGNLVTFQLRIGSSATSSPSGEVFIAGLPFASRADAGVIRYSVNVGAGWSFNTAGLIFRAHILPGDNKVRVVTNASNGGFGTLQGTNFKTGAGNNNLLISGTYPID